jgi:two-component system chemotaxis response regulator CheB
MIGICASTGGPQVLETVLSRLPPDFPIPVLIVQHMTPGFIEGLVSWLDKQVAVSVGLARDGQELAPGVWFAPDGSHLVLDAGRRLASDGRPPARGHRPAGDVLLESLAQVGGRGVVAVVLTGIGRDGCDGLAAVTAAGGRTIAQDEASCGVYGMPRVAAELGVEQILAPAAIGDKLAALVAGVPR